VIFRKVSQEQRNREVSEERRQGDTGTNSHKVHPLYSDFKQ